MVPTVALTAYARVTYSFTRLALFTSMCPFTTVGVEGFSHLQLRSDYLYSAICDAAVWTEFLTYMRRAHMYTPSPHSLTL